MRTILLLLTLLAIALPCLAQDTADEPPLSDDTYTCLGCHELIHPGLVEGWRKSRHAQVTPGEAIQKKGLALKVSAGDKVPEELRENVVGCAECHLLRPDAHADTFDHEGYNVHIVVSPKDCATCHIEEQDQYSRNIMSHAYGNLVENPVYMDLAQKVNGVPVLADGELKSKPQSDHAFAESCLYCHGTKLEVTGTEERDTILGVFEIPVIKGWPNQGSGRINLDGSRGSCTACHTRHQLSIEEARKPYTCKECHSGPDVPAYQVYSASKHGTIYSSVGDDWNFTNVPWTIGKDFRTPTCGACHVGLLVNLEGEVVAERSHDMSPRLPWRIFGLPYAHPQPKDTDVSNIRNKDGLPLPTALDGTFAEEYLIDEKEMDTRRETMQAICLSCHGKGWVDGHWSRFETAIEETNRMTLTGTNLLVRAWEEGLATGPADGGSIFDEYGEKVWNDIWLFKSNHVRFASAMMGGGDYGVFYDGRYHVQERIAALKDWLDRGIKVKNSK
jgi:hypothetical protein